MQGKVVFLEMASEVCHSLESPIAALEGAKESGIQDTL